MVIFSMTFTDPSPGFQDHDIFEVEYLNILRTKLLYHSNRKPYIQANIWNGTMFGDLDCPLNASRGLSAIAEFLVSRRKAEKLRSAEADVAGTTGSNLVKRQT